MDKIEFRKNVIEKIASFDDEYIINSNGEIFRVLTSLPDVLSAKRIFTYLSIGREVDTRRFIDYCFSLGKQIAIPIIHDGIMTFAEFSGSPDELNDGVYGIPSPSIFAKRLVPDYGDVIIVPGLCYDESLYRLGRGGGYYDGFLADCKAKAIGLCREKLICSKVPLEAHDIPVSLIVTENKNRGH